MRPGFSRPVLTGAALLAAVILATLPTAASRPLEQQVVIKRDTFGIPHIVAESEEAAAFGLGYAQAEDHATLLGRRVLEARGAAASVFGQEALENDLSARRVDNLEEARRHLDVLDKGFRAALRAFAGGVNRYASQHRAEVPAWMPTVTETDLLAASRGDAIDKAFAPWIEQALRRKYGPTQAPGAAASAAAAGSCSASGTLVRLEPDTTGEWEFADTGSNALALAGSRTTSGRPILLGNPHLRWSSRYWEAHLIVPGRLNFYGSTLVGIPWLRAGFNDRLGYVQTNNAPDYQDVYAFPLDPARQDGYLLDGKPQRLIARDIEVQVREADGSTRTERRTHWSSSLGPVVFRTADRVFVLKSAGLDSWHHFEGFHRLSRVRSLREYERVLNRGPFYMSNFTYADADGHVLYRWMTRLPRRPGAAAAHTLDVPGEKRFIWTKIHSTGDLPRLLDPPGGSIQNANNPPWFTTTRDRLDPARHPASVERGDLGLRPQIALQMLDATARFSVDDVVRLKYTTRMLLAERVRPALLAAIEAREAPSVDLQRAREVLAAWDGRVDATSVGAVLFARFWETYRAAVSQPYAERWDEHRPFETPRGLADPAAALDHLERAVRWVRDKHGSETVAWGDAHRFRFGDLDLPADGASGQLGVYRVMGFDEAKDGRRIAGWAADGSMAGTGDAWVLLVQFTQPVQAWSVLAYGQSGDRNSPHARDQIRTFADHRLRPVYFTEAEIAAHLEREYRP